MNDIEELLRQSEPAEPSARLDDRVERLLFAHSRRRVPMRIPLWAVAAACLVSVALGWTLRSVARPEPAATPAGPTTERAVVRAVHNPDHETESSTRRNPFATPVTEVQAFIIAKGGKS